MKEQNTWQKFIVSRCEKIPDPTPEEMLTKYRGRVVHLVGNDYYLQPLDLPSEH